MWHLSEYVCVSGVRRHWPPLKKRSPPGCNLVSTCIILIQPGRGQCLSIWPRCDQMFPSQIVLLTGRPSNNTCCPLCKPFHSQLWPVHYLSHSVLLYSVHLAGDLLRFSVMQKLIYTSLSYIYMSVHQQTNDKLTNNIAVPEVSLKFRNPTLVCFVQILTFWVNVYLKPSEAMVSSLISYHVSSIIMWRSQCLRSDSGTLFCQALLIVLSCKHNRSQTMHLLLCGINGNNVHIITQS